MIIDNSQIKASSLQLRRYFVTQLNILANSVFDVAKGVVQNQADLRVAGEMSPTDDPATFQIKLNIQIQPGAESNLPYSIVIEIVGIFKSGFTGTKEDIERVVSINGCSMLYGTAREIVRATTAVGAYSHILLPSIVFWDPGKPEAPTIASLAKVRPPTSD
jgi:preprotein translocase subunit SecB